MDFPRLIIGRPTQRLCNHYALNACIGGRSHVRQGDSRGKSLHEDQFSGQIGNLVGSVFILGREQGFQKYIQAREEADSNPYKGDGGYDIPSVPIDFKCSRRRSLTKPLSTYNMIIRPREVHKDWVFMQMLVARETGAEDIVVDIMGWAKTKDLPDSVEKTGIFEGAYVLPVRDLRDPRELGSCHGIRL